MIHLNNKFRVGAWLGLGLENGYNHTCI